MRLTPEALLQYAIPDVNATINPNAAALYALSVGYGSDAVIPEELPYVALAATPQKVAPTMANTIAHPGHWLARAGAQWEGVVHAEQRLTVYHAIPLGAKLISHTRVLSVTDRGASGLFVSFQSDISTTDGALIATRIQTDACRFDGGIGSAGMPPPTLTLPPDRPADTELHVELPANAALLYQLNGDDNALHTIPAAAQRVGYDTPILHGLCTIGWVAHAIERHTQQELRGFEGRFTSTIHPGATARIQLWATPTAVAFRVYGPDTSRPVIDRGKVLLS
ncbi:MAG: MaoC family dehydratase N-terminal domain-containing protein [Ancrocorticia sp.]|jgi:acyl dehydratase|nr:MaoC family dehydratase N-terminal domain-containing protein [Ancrocorticia sp.]